MPIEYSWLVEGRVVAMKSSGVLTAEDLISEESVMANYLAHATAPLLHIVADQTGLQKFPDLKLMSSSRWPRDPRVGWFVMYGLNNKILSFVASIGAQLFRMRIRMVSTRADALAFLQKVDSTLPNLDES